MTYSLILMRRALIDVRAILRWLKKRSPSGMVSWRDALDDCLQEVIQDPYRYEKAAEGLILP